MLRDVALSRCGGWVFVSRVFTEPTMTLVQVKRKLLEERKTMKPFGEPARRKAHWDYVLEEMKWMANDFWQVHGCGAAYWEGDCSRRVCVPSWEIVGGGRSWSGFVSHAPAFVPSIVFMGVGVGMLVRGLVVVDDMM